MKFTVSTKFVIKKANQTGKQSERTWQLGNKIQKGGETAITTGLYGYIKDIIEGTTVIFQ